MTVTFVNWIQVFKSVGVASAFPDFVGFRMTFATLINANKRCL
jgi:hypothetical protein